jgi:hypothetical protein
MAEPPPARRMDGRLMGGWAVRASQKESYDG